MAFPSDDLEGADVREYRRSVRARRAAFVGLAAFLSLAIATSVVALIQWDRAEQQTDVAVSQRLAIQAASIAARKLDLALLLAAAGHRLNASPQTGQGLLAVLSQSPELSGFDHRLGDALGTMALSSDRRMLAVVEQDGALHLVDAQSDRPNYPPVKTRVGSALDVAFSPDGRRIAVAGDRGTQLYDLHDLEPIGRVLPEDGAIEWAFVDEGRTVDLRERGRLDDRSRGRP